MRRYVFSGTRIAQVSIRMTAAAIQGCVWKRRVYETGRLPMTVTSVGMNPSGPSREDDLFRSPLPGAISTGTPESSISSGNWFRGSYVLDEKDISTRNANPPRRVHLSTATDVTTFTQLDERLSTA